MISPVIDAGDDLPLTLPRLLRRQAKLGDHILAACDDQRISYGEAEARSRRLARGLLAMGATKGSHVALLYPPSPDFIVGMLAAARIGAVVAPLSTLSTADELRGLIANSDTGFLLAATGFRAHRYDEALQRAFPELDYGRPPPLHAPAAPWLQRIWFSGPAPAGRDPGWSIEALEAAGDTVDDAWLEAVEDRVTPADRFFIVHTSGSTNAPKRVIHQHGSAIRTLNNINEIRSHDPEVVLFSTSPWFWVAGFAYNLLGSFISGARIVMSNATEASETLDLLERERVTHTLGYWQTVSRLAADPSFAGRDLSTIRYGNLYPIMTEDTRARDPGLRYNIYGMSEVAGALTLMADESDLPERLRGCFGHVLPGFEAKIVDTETGEACAPGDLGEIWVRGPFMMEGYYGRHRSQVFDSAGWYRTGDVGSFDTEDNLYLKGRLGDMIKTAGANVSPREVEAVLNEVGGGPLPIVLGVPDPERGQLVAAVLITDQAIDEADLRRRLADKLSSYKVPRRIFALNQSDLPVLSSGKPDMRKLAEIVAARCAATPGQPERAPPRAAAK
jgi:acyl-CoA synthetase (AMP-forming)/AMP-acid ligase II